MPMYKTKLCQKFMATGQCNRGEECSFAHGHRELRQAPPGGPGGSRGPPGVPPQDMPGMGPGPGSGPGPMGMNPVRSQISVVLLKQQLTVAEECARFLQCVGSCLVWL